MKARLAYFALSVAAAFTVVCDKFPGYERGEIVSSPGELLANNDYVVGVRWEREDTLGFVAAVPNPGELAGGVDSFFVVQYTFRVIEAFKTGRPASRVRLWTIEDSGSGSVGDPGFSWHYEDLLFGRTLTPDSLPLLLSTLAPAEHARALLERRSPEDVSADWARDSLLGYRLFELDSLKHVLTREAASDAPILYCPERGFGITMELQTFSTLCYPDTASSDCVMVSPSGYMRALRKQAEREQSVP